MSHPCAINCYSCGKCVWEGGRHDPTQWQIIDLPFTDGQELLTAYADAHCHRRDCLHTTIATDAAHMNSPEGLADQIAELRAKFASLDHREG